MCRKATKISQEQIKEDASKHQRRAHSTALESCRGNELETVDGKSLLCFPSVFRKTGFTFACILSPSSKERDVPCKWLAASPPAGWAGCEGTAAGGWPRGSQGTRFLSNTLLPGCSECSSLKQWSLFRPRSVQKVYVLGENVKMWFD